MLIENFFFRAHFNYENPEKSEMSFTKSDVFHVVDTLHNGVVGSWQAFRMGNYLINYFYCIKFLEHIIYKLLLLI